MLTFELVNSSPSVNTGFFFHEMLKSWEWPGDEVTVRVLLCMCSCGPHFYSRCYGYCFYLGTKMVEKLSDKQLYYIHRMGARTDQACLYNTSPNSVLYQEMLSFKASQASSFSVITDG